VCCQIVFECVVLDTESTGEFDVDEGGMFVTSLHLQAAAWDYDNDCLADATYVHSQLQHGMYLL